MIKCLGHDMNESMAIRARGPCYELLALSAGLMEKYHYQYDRRASDWLKGVASCVYEGSVSVCVALGSRFSYTRGKGMICIVLLWDFFRERRNGIRCQQVSRLLICSCFPNTVPHPEWKRYPSLVLMVSVFYCPCDTGALSYLHC